MENKKVFQYIAGACFALVAVLGLVSAFTSRYGFYFRSAIAPIAFLIVAIGLFLNKPIIATVGSGIVTIYTLYNFTTMLGRASGMYYVYMVFIIASYALLTMTTLLHNSSMTTAIISAVARMIYLAIIAIMGGGTSGVNVITALLYAVGVIMIGLAFSTQKKNVAPVSNAPIRSQSSNSIEQITKLKGLLDKGIITKEEFEAKKKEILG